MTELLVRPEQFRDRIETFGYDICRSKLASWPRAGNTPRKPAPTNWRLSFWAESVR